MTAMAMPKEMDQRARGQQQPRQIGNAQCDVGTVFGQQVVRADREQEPETKAHLPRTFGPGTIDVDPPL
ncbi:hypothetical protein [Lysobacter niastensis]|uniref:hypothetical protein n=1 Tax=Lysobacter niastensis TaxID=380629 RepID=UPI00361BA122